MSKSKKVLLLVLALVVVAAIVAAIGLHPYYAMPPENTAVLDAKLAEFYKIATEMQNRPKADRELLNALADDLYQVGLVVKDKPTADACPAYDLERLKTLKPQLDRYLAFDERLHALVDHGPVIQQDYGIESDLPNFSGIRALANWELAAAVLDIKEGRREDGMRRIHAVVQLTGGLIQTPTLLYVMIGVALETYLNQAVAYLLPLLTPAEGAQIKEWLTALPDYRPAFLAAMKTEFASQVTMVDQLGGGPTTASSDTLNMVHVVGDPKKPGVADSVADSMTGNKTLGRAMIWLAQNTGYYRRERYMMVSIGARLVDETDKWLGGPLGATFDDSAIRELIMHSPTAMIAVPNWSSLAKKCTEAMQHRAVVSTALANAIAGQKTFELPYGADQRIVVVPEHGCIEKTNQPAARSAGQ